jgi:antibiotic biosynthesis monooxygenase (ABM) superfamily enzyme
MAVVSFAAIWPLSILFNGLVVPAVLSWPLLLRASLFPLGLVPLLTFLIMPRLSRVLRHWLYSVD